MILAVGSSSGCYLAHERPTDDASDGSSLDAGSVDAASLDAASLDAGLDALRWDAGVDAWVGHDAACRNHAFVSNSPCTPELEARCQQFAIEEAVGRLVYAHCVTVAGSTYCAAGDYCEADGRCRCTATRQCADAIEVCVSDTADGPHYCLRICTPR